METNPYAPPKAKVADAEPGTHGLKHRSVLVMVLFTILTLGVYYLIWWFRRRRGLNRLDSPRKLAMWPLLLMVALFVIQFFIGLAEGAAPEVEIFGEDAKALGSLFQLVVAIVMIVQTFKVKDMIEDHATPALHSAPMFAEHVKLSGLMTFFFSIYYLQWAINHYVVDRNG
jgi:hypothetical protein